MNIRKQRPAGLLAIMAIVQISILFMLFETWRAQHEAEELRKGFRREVLIKLETLRNDCNVLRAEHNHFFRNRMPGVIWWGLDQK